MEVEDLFVGAVAKFFQLTLEGAKVDKEDDGTIKIAASDTEAAQAAQKRINDIVAEAELGVIYTGKVVKTVDFGAFVNFLGTKDGLVHISQISEERVEKVKDHLKEGEEVTARVIKIDTEERRIGLSIKAADYDEDALAKEVATYDDSGEDLTTSLGDLLDEATAESQNED